MVRKFLISTNVGASNTKNFFKSFYKKKLKVTSCSVEIFMTRKLIHSILIDKVKDMKSHEVVRQTWKNSKQKKTLKYHIGFYF